MSRSSFLKWQVWNSNPIIKNISKLNIIIINKILTQVYSKYFFKFWQMRNNLIYAKMCTTIIWDKINIIYY